MRIKMEIKIQMDHLIQSRRQDIICVNTAERNHVRFWFTLFQQTAEKCKDRQVSGTCQKALEIKERENDSSVDRALVTIPMFLGKRLNELQSPRKNQESS